jgi:hypothetical protein
VDVLSAVLACSLYPDPELVAALVNVQSRGHTYLVGDLTDPDNVDAADSATAVATYVAYRRKGHRVGLGLLGIPTDLLPGRRVGNPAALWDGCFNIRVGTLRLRQLDQRCRRVGSKVVRDGSRNRGCVVTAFARDLGLPARMMLWAVFVQLYPPLRPTPHPPPRVLEALR